MSAVKEAYTKIDELRAVLGASKALQEEDIIEQLQALQQALCKAIDAKAKAMVTAWALQGYTRFSKRIKHKRCSWCRSCYGAIWRFVGALREFGAMELKQHERELLQMRELVDGLFQMEVKDSNLDEVVANWNLLYDMTSQLTCRAGFMLMRKLVWTPDTRLALVLSRTLTTALTPYPPELVRVFKTKATMRLRASYLLIVREIDTTLVVIRRIQGYQTQAYHLLGTALIAVFIGLANFISRIGFDFVSRSSTYQQHFSSASTGEVAADMSRQLAALALGGAAGAAGGSDQQYMDGDEWPESDVGMEDEGYGSSSAPLDSTSSTGSGDTGMSTAAVLAEGLVRQLPLLLFAGLAAVYVYEQLRMERAKLERMDQQQQQMKIVSSKQLEKLEEVSSKQLEKLEKLEEQGQQQQVLLERICQQLQRAGAEVR